MARKLLLIPADQYHHMLSAQKEDDPLLAHTEKEMKSLMSGRRKRKGPKGKKRMNISVRRALYDQQLNRYIKQKKEAKSRPVKVEVVNKGGTKLILTPKAASEEKVGTLPGDEGEREASARDVNFTTPMGNPPLFSNPSTTRATVDSRLNGSSSGGRKKSVRRAKAQGETERLAKGQAKFEAEVWKNREALRINDEGEVLGTGNDPINDSDYREVVKMMFGINLKEFHPKGGEKLRQRIIKHAILGPLYKSLKSGVGTPQSGRGLKRSRFRPSRWTF
jgi:hypothetical protein